MNKHCLAEFRKHWECLDNNNQQLWQCRKFERPLNKCVFDNLVRYAEKRIWSPVETRPGVRHANNSTEAGEEDTRCTRKRGPCPRAQAPDLRPQHHHPVEYKGKLMEVKVEVEA